MKGSDPSTTPKLHGKAAHWFDYRRNVDKVYWSIVGMCAVLMVVEPFYHKHPYLGFDGNFGFYGWYGFLAGILLALVGRQMGSVLARSDDFYSDAAGKGEDHG